MMLLLTQAIFAGNLTFIRNNLYLLPAITLYSAALVLLASTTMLALSSMAKSSRFVAVMYAGLFFFTLALFNALRGITGTSAFAWLAPTAALQQLGDVIFRLQPRYQLSPALAVAIAAVLILAATKPNTLRVQRAIRIKAPAERIFPLINDFHQWITWSPYENKDPAMKRTYSGADSGKGAVYAWDGDKNVGSGRMEILETALPSKILIKLDFFKPFEGHNTAEFTMLPQGDVTNLTWTMTGPAVFMSKVMQVFMNLDRMIGRDFETGLANLKKLTEE